MEKRGVTQSFFSFSLVDIKIGNSYFSIALLLKSFPMLKFHWYENFNTLSLIQ